MDEINNKRRTFEDVYANFLVFSRQAFGVLPPGVSLLKAKEEIDELDIEIRLKIGSDNLLEEFADVVTCLIAELDANNHTIYDLIEAIHAKTEKNKLRKWIQNENGTFSHAPEDWDDQKGKEE